MDYMDYMQLSNGTDMSKFDYETPSEGGDDDFGELSDLFVETQQTEGSNEMGFDSPHHPRDDDDDHGASSNNASSAINTNASTSMGGNLNEQSTGSHNTSGSDNHTGFNQAAVAAHPNTNASTSMGGSLNEQSASSYNTSGSDNHAGFNQAIVVAHPDADSGFDWNSPFVQSMMWSINGEIGDTAFMPPTEPSMLETAFDLPATSMQPLVAPAESALVQAEVGAPPFMFPTESFMPGTTFDLPTTFMQPSMLPAESALPQAEVNIFTPAMTQSMGSVQSTLGQNKGNVPAPAMGPSTPPKQMQQRSTHLPSPPSEPRAIAVPRSKLKIGHAFASKNDPKSVEKVFAKVASNQKISPNTSNDVEFLHSVKRKQSVSKEQTPVKKPRDIKTLPNGARGALTSVSGVSRPTIPSATRPALNIAKNTLDKYEVVTHKGRAWAILPLPDAVFKEGMAIEKREVEEKMQKQREMEGKMKKQRELEEKMQKLRDEARRNAEKLKAYEQQLAQI